MILGIDLGTTYSVASYLDENGEPCVITNMEGSQTTPSVVFFESNNSVIVGQSAKDNSILDSNNVVSAVKNMMGKKCTYKSTYGIEYSPEMISSFILKKIVSDAEKRLDLTQKIKDVIITIPAYFNDSQRKATEDAAKIAGLNLLATINEPTAAALYYAVKSKLNHANILVYDIGGGTFDVTIIRIDDEEVVVKSTGGLLGVGGRFFDEEIVDYIVDFFYNIHNIDLSDDEYFDIYQELFVKAEKAKIQLSNQTKTTVPIRVGNIKENVVLTREKIEEIVARLYSRTEYTVKKALNDAKMQVNELDKVLLVGGTSKIPYIERKISELIGQQPSHEVHPDLVVAQGAAIYGNQIMGKNQIKKISDVCSHSIGILMYDTGRRQRYNCIQIKRNSLLPIEKKVYAKTNVDNQEAINIDVTEGEFEEITDVSIIFSDSLPLPDGVKAGTRIEIVLSLDKSQLVHIYIEIPSIEYKKEFSFERTANLSIEDIERYTSMVLDCEIN